MKNQPIYLKNYTPSNFLVEKIDLTFDLYDDKVIVTNEMTLYKNPKLSVETKNLLSLDWKQLELLSIYLNWKELEKQKYEIKENKLFFDAWELDKFSLKIITKIFPKKNTSLEWLYYSGWKFCTQCESEGFRKMTYYLDRPDIMSKFSTKITASKKDYPVLLSNGNLLEKWNLENNRHFTKWEDPFKKPAYIFALVAWNLDFIEDKFTTMSGKKVTLRIFTENHNIPKCNFAMDSLKKSMKWDEEKFGREYDLELFMIVAVDDFNHWAMENKGLNVFNSEVIFATPESATDNDYIYIERVVAHEYFHNWTGNRVTCRDWFQLSLKEWLTVFRDSEFIADMYSRTVKRIWDVKLLRDHQFKEDAWPITHPVRPSFYEEISNFYTSTVYNKWAEIIGMYKTLLWKEGFRKGMDLYFSRHDGQAVTTEDFLKCMTESNKIDGLQFQNWYDQAGTPVVEVKSIYNPETKIYTLKFKQSCRPTPETKDKKPFVIPIKYWLFSKDWKEVEAWIITLTKFEEEFSFENIDSELIPSLLRDFSAPVKLNYNYSHEDYLFLIKYETNEFNRFEIVQKYFLETLLKSIYSHNVNENQVDKEKIIIDENLINIFKNIIEDDKLNNEFKAESLELPSEAFLIDNIWKNINPVLVHEVREYFKEYLAKSLESKFEGIYNKLNVIKKYEVNTSDIWDRKLKNLCLDYLTYTKWISLAYNQYKNSNNMTDTQWAFISMVKIKSEETQEALNDFYEKWKDDGIVINKWFRFNSLYSDLEGIKELETHKKFDKNNPNKVRALYFVFATLNIRGFHSIDWEWYKFIADKAIELNNANPTVASRLAKFLIDWRKLEPVRSDLMKKELKRIAGVWKLSADVEEIVKKGLGI